MKEEKLSTKDTFEQIFGIYVCFFAPSCVKINEKKTLGGNDQWDRVRLLPNSSRY